MKRAKWPLLLFVCATVPAGAQNPIGETDFLLSKHKAGRLTIGMSVDEVFEVYSRDDIDLVDLNLEGGFTPALEIYIEGGHDNGPSLQAEYTLKDWWVIWRITVPDDRFRTEEGIGVGSTMGDIREHYKVSQAGVGEGGIGVYVAELEMGFGLAIDLMDLPDGWQKAGDPDKIPDSTVINSVGVHRWGY
jgi:hypothetical protein